MFAAPACARVQSSFVSNNLVANQGGTQMGDYYCCPTEASCEVQVRPPSLDAICACRL
jgi:hypothetical protein